MDVVYTGKWQYEIQEQKEVPVWYGIPSHFEHWPYMILSSYIKWW
jgi:hypothetical protein